MQKKPIYEFACIKNIESWIEVYRLSPRLLSGGLGLGGLPCADFYEHF